MSSFLRKGAKVAKLEKGIHSNCKITGVDIDQRKGNSGIINKLMYTKFAYFADNKKKSEIELSWWKPDETSEYFYINLQSMFNQVYNVLSCYYSVDELDPMFDDVFSDIDGLTTAADVQTRKWKKSELDAIYKKVSAIYHASLSAKMDAVDLCVKITTNYKGEGAEIPRYGSFVEVMSETPTLKFTDRELRDHSKSGNVTTASNTSSNTTI